MVPTRRHLLKAAAIGGPGLLAAPPALAAAAPAEVTFRLGSIRTSDLASHFDVELGIDNLEAGYWSMMPRVVAKAYAEHNTYANEANAIWARNVLPGAAEWTSAVRGAQAALARQVGCRPEEIGITRSGADALHMLITTKP